MITYKTGNLLDAPVEALVNTVNTVGIMGKGIALQFKTTFPENFKAYADAVKKDLVQLGKVLIVPVNPIGPVKYIINFPTKAHWRFPSQLPWIEAGLRDLRDKIIEYRIQSIALPPLGCGNGGLDWNLVRPLVEKELSSLNSEILVYEPNAEIRELLKKEDRPSASKLTPVRAMLLKLLYDYRALGEFASEFAAEKLSYFLQRFGEKQLKLDFQKGFYGPYSGKVRHVLYDVNGYYIKGYEQKDTKPFEPLQLMVNRSSEVQDYIKNELTNEQRQRLDKVAELIHGFESPYGLELLATVDFLLHDSGNFNPDDIAEKFWSERKKSMFQEQHIQMAVEHLSTYKKDLYRLQ